MSVADCACAAEANITAAQRTTAFHKCPMDGSRKIQFARRAGPLGQA
jgi:hypothetical protein